MATRPHSRSLILRAAPFLASRIRQNATLLRSRLSSSSAMPEQQPEHKSQNDSVFMTENCVRRMKELQASEPEEKMLRLSIEAGGCSGFQYEFSLDGKANADDSAVFMEAIWAILMFFMFFHFIQTVVRYSFFTNTDFFFCFPNLNV
ncbi:unnamed protein product [Cuscuta campestris]|uniref:FeS cluster biogenesis domain-containing protein n=1 Tax=Cuscuta campestris TaxID=132261 RepID=A0A484NKP3_9ASTE|nr:unnamed protein product [Cuscuta campestris]